MALHLKLGCAEKNNSPTTRRRKEEDLSLFVFKELSVVWFENGKEHFFYFLNLLTSIEKNQCVEYISYHFLVIVFFQCFKLSDWSCIHRAFIQFQFETRRSCWKFSECSKKPNGNNTKNHRRTRCVSPFRRGDKYARFEFEKRRRFLLFQIFAFQIFLSKGKEFNIVKCYFNVMHSVDIWKNKHGVPIQDVPFQILQAILKHLERVHHLPVNSIRNFNKN